MTSLTTISAKNRSKLMLLTLAALFIAPVLAASLLLKTGWYQALGTTNHGQLVEPPLALKALFPELVDSGHTQRHWTLLFVQPEPCDAACKNTLYLLDQIPLAMGPDRHRIARLIVTPRHRDRITTQRQKIQQEHPALTGSNHLLLVDPEGYVFMHYPAHADRQRAIREGKNIVNDLKHALKLSRIG